MEPFIISGEAELKQVWHLTYMEYLTKGYCLPNPSEMLTHYEHLDRLPETTIFGIRDGDGKLIATNSFTEDGPAGLHTDKSFPLETAQVRNRCYQQGLKLGGYWRIITSSECRQRTRVIRALIDYSLKFGVENGFHRFLFTFNPRHQRRYEKMLGLVVIGGPVHDVAVHGASAVLMLGEAWKMQETWANGLGKGL